MLVISKRCKRCGKEFVPAPLHVYRIYEDFYCSYTCHLHEVTEREEAKQKKEEAALERRRLQQKKRRIGQYRFDKNNMEPYPAEKIPGQCRAVLKCRADNGEVVQRFASLKEAALAEGISDAAMSRRINRECKRKQKFIWKFEEE